MRARGGRKRRRAVARVRGAAHGVLAAALVAGAAHAIPQIDPDQAFELTADVVEYQSQRDLYVASGAVRVVQGERRIHADWVAFNNETRRAIAAGNVRVLDGPELVEAELVQFDIDTLEGVLFEGYYDTGRLNFRVWARSMEKVGPQDYEIEHGRFTTCRCPDPDGREPWSVDAGEADVEIGGYGFTKNTVFRVLDFPILYLPWMFFPVKTDRESGLLFPLLGVSGRNGFEFGVPLFWAARENVNVTLTPVYMTERGFKPELDIATVYGEKSFLRLQGSFVWDQKIDPDTPATPFGRARWFARGQLDQELPWDWQIRGDVNLISDNEYVVDFEDMARFRLNRFLESTLFALGSAGRDRSVGMRAGVRYADDLQSPDDLDRDEILLQRAPEVAVDWAESRTPVPGLVASFDSEYIHFGAFEDVQGAVDPAGYFSDVGIDALPNTRENPRAPGSTADFNGDDFDLVGNPSGPQGDARFEEGEPLADRGHRLMLRPRLALPFRPSRLFEVYPEVGYAQTLYFTEADDFAQRGLFTARVDLRSRIAGRFDLPILPATRHVVEPVIGWAYVRHYHQRPDNPIFVPETALPARMIRQLSMDNITRDTADRIDNANLLRFGIGNRFFAGAQGRLRADVELSIAYDFERQKMDLLILDGETFPRRGVSSRFSLAFDADALAIDQALLTVFSRLPRWGPVTTHLAGSYRYRRDVPKFFEDFRDGRRYRDFEAFQHVSQIDTNLRFNVGESWAFLYRLGYSLERSLLLTNAGGVEYVSKCRCWAIGLDLSDDRTRGVQFFVRFNLLGLGDSPGNPFAEGVGVGSNEVR